MTEQERIHALPEEGKISQEEADLLLEALSDEPEDDFEQDAQAGEDQQENHAFTAPPPPREPASPTAPAPPAPAPPHAAAAPGELRWVSIAMMAGNLIVNVDKTLDAPVLAPESSSEAELKQQNGNWELKFRPLEQRILGGLAGSWQGGMTILRLPSGFGIEVDSKAGNLELNGVPYLRGRIMAGQLDAYDLSGIDLDMKAGNLDASLKLESGDHRIDMKAGSAKLRLLPGSSVRVSGSVKAGSMSLRGPFTSSQELISGHFEGSVGSGSATLTIQQKAGNIRLEAEGEAS